MLDNNNNKNAEVEVNKDLYEYSHFDHSYSEMRVKKLNGAVNPTIIFKSNSKIQISREELKKILIIENELRLDKETLQKFDDQDNDMKKMYVVDEQVIKLALKKYGFNPERDDSFKAYLLSTGKYITLF